MSKNNEKQPDILDEIRGLDKMVRKFLLIRLLAHVKFVSKKILRYKEGIRSVLAEAGIPEEDIKRIIDFVNESPEVKLTEQELKEARQESRDFVKGKRRDIEQEIEKQSPKFPNVGSDFYNTLGTQESVFYTSLANSAPATDEITFTNSAGESLNLKA